LEIRRPVKKSTSAFKKAFSVGRFNDERASNGSNLTCCKVLLLGAHGVQVAPKIKGHLMDKGNALVGYQPLGNIPNFFRMILSNPASTYNDADQLLDEIAMFGEL